MESVLKLNLGRFNDYVMYLPGGTYSECVMGQDDVVYYYKHPCVGADDAIDKISGLTDTTINLPHIEITASLECGRRGIPVSIDLFLSKLEKDIINKINILLENAIRDGMENIHLGCLRISVHDTRYYFHKEDHSDLYGYTNVTIALMMKSNNLVPASKT